MNNEQIPQQLSDELSDPATWRRLYWVCWRILDQNHHDAEDAAQLAVIQSVKYGRSLDLSRPVSPWLVAVARRVCFSILERRTKAIASMTEYRERCLADQPEPPSETGTSRFEIQQKVQGAISRLTPRQQAMLEERFCDGKTPRQIAKAHGCARQTVVATLDRAVRSMRPCLDPIW